MKIVVFLYSETEDLTIIEIVPEGSVGGYDADDERSEGSTDDSNDSDIVNSNLETEGEEGSASQDAGEGKTIDIFDPYRILIAQICANNMDGYHSLAVRVRDKYTGDEAGLDGTIANCMWPWGPNYNLRYYSHLLGEMVPTLIRWDVFFGEISYIIAEPFPQPSEKISVNELVCTRAVKQGLWEKISFLKKIPTRTELLTAGCVVGNNSTALLRRYVQNLETFKGLMHLEWGAWSYQPSSHHTEELWPGYCIYYIDSDGKEISPFFLNDGQNLQDSGYLSSVRNEEGSTSGESDAMVVDDPFSFFFGQLATIFVWRRDFEIGE
ncbi:hypothetical protein Nepgr_004277 [Nepenthes gracilis]|uniref:Uncharacterized protein n=1 Tax=Nepenthes gracilis TaxID=150966 RepID=A0AAD3S121_NEPGR|nr:hypothetical protein Nepgr_004277 [Nepenthes gracilis]